LLHRGIAIFGGNPTMLQIGHGSCRLDERTWAAIRRRNTFAILRPSMRRCRGGLHAQQIAP
jgi:hypothetical protein